MIDYLKRLSAYRKSLGSLVGGVLTWAGVAYVPDGHVDRAEWYALSLVIATAAGVYAVANDDAPVMYTEADAQAQKAA